MKSPVSVSCFAMQPCQLFNNILLLLVSIDIIEGLRRTAKFDLFGLYTNCSLRYLLGHYV